MRLEFVSNGHESETPVCRGDAFKFATVDLTVCAVHLTKGDRLSVKAVTFLTCDALCIGNILRDAITNMGTDAFRQMLNRLQSFL